MRILFLTLVLANLAFAAWHNWFAVSDRPFPVRNVDVAGITLVSELANSDVEAEQVEVAKAEPEAPRDEAQSCVSVGPFRELAQAVTAGSNLRAGGYDPVQRAGEGDIWLGYWVYIEGIATLAEANGILAQLRDNGVSDSYVIPATDNGNLVSLGVFSEISRAGTRREDVRKLGHEPTIADRTRRGTVYWVDVMIERGQSIDIELLRTPGRIDRLEQRSCEDASA